MRPCDHNVFLQGVFQTVQANQERQTPDKARNYSGNQIQCCISPTILSVGMDSLRSWAEQDCIKSSTVLLNGRPRCKISYIQTLLKATYLICIQKPPVIDILHILLVLRKYNPVLHFLSHSFEYQDVRNMPREYLRKSKQRNRKTQVNQD